MRWLNAMVLADRLDSLNEAVPQFKPVGREIVQNIWFLVNRHHRILVALEVDASVGEGDLHGLREHLIAHLSDVDSTIKRLFLALRETHLRAAAHELGSVYDILRAVRKLTLQVDAMREIDLAVGIGSVQSMTTAVQAKALQLPMKGHAD